MNDPPTTLVGLHLNACVSSTLSAACSSGEYVSSFGFSGSRTPPRLRLITRAPLSTAQRIAATSPSSETVPSVPTTLATISCALNASPAIPSLFDGFAAITMSVVIVVEL